MLGVEKLTGPVLRTIGRKRCAFILAWLFAVVFAAPIPASAVGPYLLAPGDRITLKVNSEPDLGGDFTIDDVGEIEVPLLGNLHVAGLTIAECRKKIEVGLSNGLLKLPSVSVRVAELQPVRVLGDVRNAGVYPYSYNSIAKTAIAQAGGFGRGAMPTQSELIAAEERLKIMEQNWNRLLIRKARLEAQLGLTSEFVTPQHLSLPAEAAQQITAEELQTLKEQHNGYQKQIDTLTESAVQLGKQESDINEQVKSENRLAELVKQRINAYSKLSEHGLGRGNTALDLELSLATREGEVWRLEVERSRLHVAEIEVESKKQALESQYKQNILTDVAEVRQKLGELEASLPYAREQRAYHRERFDAGEDEEIYSIKITRVDGNDVMVTNATPITRLQPGDIVEVTINRLSHGDKQAALNQSRR